MVDTSDQKINAYAAPGRVILTFRLVSFCLNDDELALVEGHELAHQAFGHLTRGAGQRRLGGMAGTVWNLTGLFATQTIGKLANLGFFLGQERHSPHVFPCTILAAIGIELVAAKYRPFRHRLRHLNGRVPLGQHSRHHDRERTGLRLAHSFGRLSHGLPDGVECEIFLLAETD